MRNASAVQPSYSYGQYDERNRLCRRGDGSICCGSLVEPKKRGGNKHHCWKVVLKGGNLVCGECGADIPVSILAAHAARGNVDSLRVMLDDVQQNFYPLAIAEWDERHRRELGIYYGSGDIPLWALAPIRRIWENGILPIYLPTFKQWFLTDRENIPPSPVAGFSEHRLLAPLYGTAGALPDHIKRISGFFPGHVQVRLPKDKEEWRALHQASRSWRGQWDASGTQPNWPESFDSWIGSTEDPELLYCGTMTDYEPERGKVAYAFLLVEDMQRVVSVT